MNFQFKDVVEATAKAVALRDERIRCWNDIVSKTNTIIAVSKIMAIKDQYNAIVRWMVIDQMMKGDYTEEDARLGEMCRNGIEECDKALTNRVCQAITDEIISQATKILSNIL